MALSWTNIIRWPHYSSNGKDDNSLVCEKVNREKWMDTTILKDVIFFSFPRISSKSFPQSILGFYPFFCLLSYLLPTRMKRIGDFTIFIWREL